MGLFLAKGKHGSPSENRDFYSFFFFLISLAWVFLSVYIVAVLVLYPYQGERLSPIIGALVAQLVKF